MLSSDIIIIIIGILTSVLRTDKEAGTIETKTREETVTTISSVIINKITFTIFDPLSLVFGGHNQ